MSDTMNFASFSRVVGFALLLGASACASTADDGAAASELETSEADLTAVQRSEDKAALKLFQDALIGISSSGSEGDPVAYKAFTMAWKSTDAWDADTLAKRIGGRLPEIKSAGAVYGHQGFQTGRSMTSFWKGETTADPSDADAAARASRMKTLKALCAKNLTNVTHMVVGVRSVATDASSIENGAVAPMIIGKLPSGRLVVMYGIDIWT
jgi:hypothetical protein